MEIQRIFGGSFMDLSKYKLKLRRNKDSSDDSSPQYALKYKAKSDHPRQVSFSILSALIENNDVIVILNSGLLQTGRNGDNSPIERFMGYVRELGLFHVQRNTQADQKVSILGFPAKTKNKTEIQEIAVYVPNQIWYQHFAEFLPLCGARYLVTRSSLSISNFTAHIFDMTSEELAKTFAHNIFDLAPAGQMGISSYIKDPAGIAELLGIRA